jgi:hypothetical protein
VAPVAQPPALRASAEPQRIARPDPPLAVVAAPAPQAIAGGLDAEAIAATVSRHAQLFHDCARQAATNEPDLRVAGRQVELMLSVQPSGRAMYPTLDDVELRDTELGTCLKRAGAQLEFPASAGPPARVRVPLVLGK